MTTVLYNDIHETRILIRGGGDLASGIAVRLFNSGFKVCIVETSRPLAVRRAVSFSEAVYDRKKTVEGVTAVRINRPEDIDSTWKLGHIPVLIDRENHSCNVIEPDVLVDAIVAKRNIGTSMSNAPLVIGLGPGFYAGKDCHVVIETNRGHDLGRLIFEGPAVKDTGVPASILGFTEERVLRAPLDGIFEPDKTIGDRVIKGEQIGRIGQALIYSQIDGIIRGILHAGTPACIGTKVGDIDPRGEIQYCPKISDKARSLGGSVIEAILSKLPHISYTK